MTHLRHTFQITWSSLSVRWFFFMFFPVCVSLVSVNWKRRFCWTLCLWALTCTSTSGAECDAQDLSTPTGQAGSQPQTLYMLGLKQNQCCDDILLGQGRANYFDWWATVGFKILTEEPEKMDEMIWWSTSCRKNIYQKKTWTSMSIETEHNEKIIVLENKKLKYNLQCHYFKKKKKDSFVNFKAFPLHTLTSGQLVHACSRALQQHPSLYWER